MTPRKLFSLALNSCNILNHGNDATYSGVVTSPLFRHGVQFNRRGARRLRCQFKFQGKRLRLGP
jgi:hypothetical protein